MYNKEFTFQPPMVLCTYQSATTGKQRELLVRDYSQAFMLMKQLERTGAINYPIDFAFRRVNVVVGGDSDE